MTSTADGADGGRLEGRLIGLGVCGSIAAYKSVELLRRLTAEGADVVVMLTPSATRFVGPLTFQALSRHPVETDVLDLLPDQRIGHIVIADTADAIVVAPATARWLGAMAGGIADDAVLAACLATTAPVVVAPAMDGDMWTHPATRDQRRAAAARVRVPGRRARGGPARVGPVRHREAGGARTTSSTRSSKRSATRRSASPDAAARPPIVDRLARPRPRGSPRRRHRRRHRRAHRPRPVHRQPQHAARWALAIARGRARTRGAGHADRRAASRSRSRRGSAPSPRSRPRPMRDAVLEAVFLGRADALVMAAAVADFRPTQRRHDQAHPRRRADASSSSPPRTSSPRSARGPASSIPARSSSGSRPRPARSTAPPTSSAARAPTSSSPTTSPRRARGSAPTRTGSRSWAPTGRATTCRC